MEPLPDPVPLLSLWLPILVSSVLVFLASYVAWMVLPHHRSDFAKLKNEDAVRDVLRGTPRGEYSFPNATTSAEWNSPEWKAKAEEGPNGFLTVMPDGVPNLGARLFCWFLYLIAVSVFVAYVTSRGLRGFSEPHYLQVFQLSGAVAFLAYSMAHFTGAIWQGHRWSRTFKDVIDGLVYGLLTAGTFGWLWP